MTIKEVISQILKNLKINIKSLSLVLDLQKIKQFFICMFGLMIIFFTYFNGYSCDTYISPHLTRFNERIIINNKEISTKKLYETLKYVKKINDNNPITFFEITTAAAFVLFNKSKSDFLILETGLGGRLDATNVISKKLCSIITPISFDHEEYLGRTLEKITTEKLGIIKNSNFVIVSKQKKKVKDFISNLLFSKFFIA